MTRALAFFVGTRPVKGSLSRVPARAGGLAYVGLEIGSTPLGVGLDPNVVGGAPPRPIRLWVYADDCDAAVERVGRAGSRIVEEPADQPWGERVARALDPDGNEIIFGQQASAGAIGSWSRQRSRTSVLEA